MNVSCPNCNTIYRVDPAKVPETGVRARCAVCSAVFLVRREGAGATAPASAAPAAVAAPPAPPAPKPAPAPPLGPQAVPAALAAPPAPPRPPAVPARGQMPPAMPPGAGVRPPTFRPATPSRPAGAPAAPPGGPPPPPRPPVYTAPAPTPAPAPASRPAPAPAASATSAQAALPSPARPINPFLTQDPAAKARRLARALISDMVVYHPAKRQEGLRDGTLKQLFEEEIKKSWEEYADQVGKDMADSTPYFREALNDILADGEQLF